MPVGILEVRFEIGKKSVAIPEMPVGIGEIPFAIGKVGFRIREMGFGLAVGEVGGLESGHGIKSRVSVVREGSRVMNPRSVRRRL